MFRHIPSVIIKSKLSPFTLVTHYLIRWFSQPYNNKHRKYSPVTIPSLINMQTLRRSFLSSNRFVRFSIFCTFPLSTKSFSPKSLGFSKLFTTFAAESRFRPIRSDSAGLVRRLSIKPQTFAPTIELREVIAKGELSGVMRAVPGASSNSFLLPHSCATCWSHSHNIHPWSFSHGTFSRPAPPRHTGDEQA